MILAVDSHTAGEPTRVIIGGIPNLPGNTIVEKRDYFRNNLDDIRTSLILEPRGHKNMFGAVVTAPSNPEADYGVFFMDPVGYPDMCGHGIIGISTVLIEIGMIKPKEPITTALFDTPCGLVSVNAKVRNGIVRSVTFRNLPSFHYESLKIKLVDIGEIHVDIAFGGNFYAIVNAKDLGVKVEQNNLPELINVGFKVIDAVNAKVEVKHPEKPFINKLYLVQICDEPKNPRAHAKNVVITRGGQSDRSPCGTGTCARMATLYAKGELKLNEEFVNEGILGTIFRGKLVSQTKVGKYDAVIPEITGSAYITGICTFVIKPHDPLKRGFLLS